VNTCGKRANHSPVTSQFLMQSKYVGLKGIDFTSHRFSDIHNNHCGTNQRRVLRESLFQLHRVSARSFGYVDVPVQGGSLLIRYELSRKPI
jgi:hypothetical protein